MYATSEEKPAGLLFAMHVTRLEVTVVFAVLQVPSEKVVYVTESPPVYEIRRLDVEVILRHAFNTFAFQLRKSESEPEPELALHDSKDENPLKINTFVTPKVGSVQVG
jgi:hypothetical protein